MDDFLCLRNQRWAVLISCVEMGDQGTQTYSEIDDDIRMQIPTDYPSSMPIATPFPQPTILRRPIEEQTINDYNAIDIQFSATEKYGFVSILHILLL